MATSPDKQSLRTFLADTVTLLCKNFLHFESEFSVEGLIGITLDQKDVFLISIHETVKSQDAGKVPTPKTTEAAILDAKSTTESSVTAACNVSLPQNVTTSTEDDVQNATISHDLTDIEMLHDTDNARQPVARQPVAILPDDVIKGDDSAADVKLEVGSMLDETHDAKMSNPDLSSPAIQNSVALPIVPDSHSSLEPITSFDNSKTLEKLNYLEKPGSRGESGLAGQSSESCRAGFSQSENFEVIEIKEESLSEEDFMVSNPSTQICREDFSQQGMSSAMDTTLGMGYSYWEGNPLQVMNQSTMSVSSSASNPIGAPVNRGPKTKKWKFHECLKCGSKLTTAYGLKKHDTVIHQGNYKYTCHLCGKGLRTEYNLRGHMASRHNMSKDYRCALCAREFGYRHTLKDHMLACHGVTTSVDRENSGFGT